MLQGAKVGFSGSKDTIRTQYANCAGVGRIVESRNDLESICVRELLASSFECQKPCRGLSSRESTFVGVVGVKIAPKTLLAFLVSVAPFFPVQSRV
jgi:hypothetical protein